MPCAVHETTIVAETAVAEASHSNLPPEIIPQEPEWAWSAAEAASDSKPRCHETQTELASANLKAFLGQLSASIAEINQPISAVVMNAEAALRSLLTQPRDTEAVGRLLACIVKDGMLAGDSVDRARALTDRKRTDERLRASEQQPPRRPDAAGTRGEYDDAR